MPNSDLPWPKDPRKQRFADLLLRGGKTITEAYLESGFACSNRAAAGAAGTRLRKHPEVIAYMNAVQASAADESVLTILEKRKFLARVVRTPITKLDLESDEDADLIKSYSQTTGEMSSSLRLEKLDPLKAIEIDNKLCGDDPEANAVRELAAAVAALGQQSSPLPTGKL